MKKNNLTPDSNQPSNDDKVNVELPEALQDGRAREWEDRGRVMLDGDIAPDAKTNAERDFEPENVRTEKPKDDKVY